MLDRPGRALRTYVHALRRARWLIIVGWLALFGVGGWKALDFLNATQNGGNLPNTAPSIIADRVLGETFGDKPVVWFDLDAVILRGPSNPAVSQCIHDRLATAVLGTTNILEDFFTAAEKFGAAVAQAQFRRVAAELFLIRLDPDAEDDFDDASFVPVSLNLTAACGVRQAGMQVDYTGDPLLWDSIADAMEADIVLSDSFAIPLSLAVVCYTLRSLRMVIVPILCMAGGIFLSFWIMLGVTHHMDVASYAPNLMMTIGLAMSIDYSLFCLSRYREALRAGADNVEAVVAMLFTAGKTIAVSGVILICCFLQLLFSPIVLLKSMGLGAAVTIAVILLISLTLVPVLLLTFPVFFSSAALPFRTLFTRTYCLGFRRPGVSSIFKLRGVGGAYSFNDNDNDDDDALLDSPQNAASASLSREQLEDAVYRDAKPKRNLWFRWGVVVTRRPWLFLSLCLALLLPFAYPALTFKVDNGPKSLTSRVREDFPGYNAVGAEFGFGRIFPYYMVGVEKNSTAPAQMLSPELYAAAQDLVAQLAPLAGLSNSSFVSLPVPGGAGDAATAVSYADYARCCSADCACILGATPPADCAAISALVAEFASSTCDSLLVRVATVPDPFSVDGVAFYHAARAKLVMGSAGPVQWVLARGSGEDIDAQDETMHSFPQAVIVTLVIVVVLMAGAFRALFVAVRALFTVLLTLAFSYGSVSLIYEHGVFDFLHSSSVSNTGGVSFLAPVLAFSAVVGLSLDYDIFLLVRVLEYRLAGINNQDAVIYALARTGRVITSAGVIMAIAFVSLSFAHESALNQLSMYLVLAVLLDTLVIRCVVVPAMLCVLPDALWWPRKFPAPRILDDDVLF